MVVSYPAVFYKYEEGNYSVALPDFGVATCGINLEEATRMVIDCLAGEIKWCKENGIEIPKPTLELKLIEIEEKSEDNNYVECTKQIISVDADDYAKKYFDKSVKKNVTIPKWLNEQAIEMNINFSKVLQRALLDEINKSRDEQYQIKG